MYNAKAFSAASATSPLASTTIARRDPTDTDVQIEILFCGICHSDLHQKTGELSGTPLPLIMGHENAGWVDALGAGVKGVTEGEPVVVFGGWG